MIQNKTYLNVAHWNAQVDTTIKKKVQTFTDALEGNTMH